MRKCPTCGYRLEDDQLVCPNCKTKLSKPKKVKKPANWQVIKTSKATYYGFGAKNLDQRNAGKMPGYFKPLLITMIVLSLLFALANLSIFIFENIVLWGQKIKTNNQIFWIMGGVNIGIMVPLFAITLTVQLLNVHWINTKGPAKVKSVYLSHCIIYGICLVGTLLYPIIHNDLYGLCASFVTTIFGIGLVPWLAQSIKIINKAKINGVVQPIRSVQNIGK